MLFRIGQGFDIHNISTIDNSMNPLILGGVIVSTIYEVKAHSDGDTLLHALIDSILGSLGKEDIGDLFPPTDKQWQNISSIELLQQVLLMTEYQKKWNFGNIDITIVLEAPQLGSFKQKIKQSIRKILELEETTPVAIKAKTFEQSNNSQVWVYSHILVNIL